MRESCGSDETLHSLFRDWEQLTSQSLSGVAVRICPAVCAAFDAQALTLGQTVFFGHAPNWDSPADKCLLAHEVIHVIQNRNGVATKPMSEAGDKAEEEARTMAPLLAAGSRITASCAPAAIVQCAAAAVPWPEEFKSVDEAKLWIQSGVLYDRGRDILAKLSGKSQVKFARMLAESGSAAEDFKLVLTRLKLLAKPAAWVNAMTDAGAGLPVTQQLKLWCAAARGNWHAELVCKCALKVSNSQQGAPMITKGNMVDYWDFLSREHTPFGSSDGDKYVRTVNVPLGGGGTALVYLPSYKIQHFFAGHTFKHFNVAKNNFTRSSTGQMGFWPRDKKKTAIINDAVTALTNNAAIAQLLSQDTNTWRINDTHATGVSTADVSIPYPLHLGFYRTGEKTFNLTQLYPNFDAAGGNDSVILYEPMVINMFSPLLPMN